MFERRFCILGERSPSVIETHKQWLQTGSGIQTPFWPIYDKKTINCQFLIVFPMFWSYGAFNSPSRILQFCESAQVEFFAESGKLRRIWKYAQNLAENDVFGLPTT